MNSKFKTPSKKPLIYQMNYERSNSVVKLQETSPQINLIGRKFNSKGISLSENKNDIVSSINPRLVTQNLNNKFGKVKIGVGGGAGYVTARNNWTNPKVKSLTKKAFKNISLIAEKYGYKYKSVNVSPDRSITGLQFVQSVDEEKKEEYKSSQRYKSTSSYNLPPAGTERKGCKLGRSEVIVNNRKGNILKKNSNFQDIWRRHQERKEEELHNIEKIHKRERYNSTTSNKNEISNDSKRTPRELPKGNKLNNTENSGKRVVFEKIGSNINISTGKGRRIGQRSLEENKFIINKECRYTVKNANKDEGVYSRPNTSAAGIERADANTNSRHKLLPSSAKIRKLFKWCPITKSKFGLFRPIEELKMEQEDGPGEDSKDWKIAESEVSDIGVEESDHAPMRQAEEQNHLSPISHSQEEIEYSVTSLNKQADKSSSNLFNSLSKTTTQDNILPLYLHPTGDSNKEIHHIDDTLKLVMKKKKNSTPAEEDEKFLAQNIDRRKIYKEDRINFRNKGKGEERKVKETRSVPASGREKKEYEEEQGGNNMILKIFQSPQPSINGEVDIGTQIQNIPTPNPKIKLQNNYKQAMNTNANRIIHFINQKQKKLETEFNKCKFINKRFSSPLILKEDLKINLEITDPLSKEREFLIYHNKKYYLEHKQIPATALDYYKIIRVIGRGAFGKVSLGIHKLTGKSVAIKIIHKKDINDEFSKRKVLQEIYIHKKMRHGGIIRLLEVFEHANHLLIVMEYAGGGDLLCKIKQKGRLNEWEAKPIFRQICYSIGHIHSRSVLHRDIKLDNILLDSEKNVKICDFGVSKIMNNQIIREQCGTPAYLAPEIICNEGYEGFYVDYWSLGVLLFALVCAAVPYKANNLPELYEKIHQTELVFPCELSDELEDLIRGLLVIDPYMRYSVPQMLSHPWLSGEVDKVHDEILNYQDCVELHEREQKNSKQNRINDVNIQNLFYDSSKDAVLSYNDYFNIFADVYSGSLDEHIVEHLQILGYPRDLLLLALQKGEMNHATATYNLLLLP